MRKITGLVLIGLGVGLVVLALAFPTVIYPRVAKVPANPQERIIAEGTGMTVLVPALIGKTGHGILTDQTVVSTRLVVGQVPPNGSKVPEGQAFYRQAYNAFVRNSTLSSTDSLLEADVEAASIDGLSGQATNCCGDYLLEDPNDEQGEPIRHRGLVFKFPFDTQRRNYEFWDADIKATATARFERTERIDGLLTYRFVQPVADEAIARQDVPGALVGSDQPFVTADRVYATVRTLWVEPATGAIVKGAEDVDQRLVGPDGTTAPVIKGRLEYDRATVARLVDTYRPQARQLRIVTTYGPIGGWILGPVLALVGITLLFLGRRSDDWISRWEAEADEADEADDDDEDDEDEVGGAGDAGSGQRVGA